MKIDQSGIKLLSECEGLELAAYKCPKGVWTIGLGNTFYSNGKPVKQGDKITTEQAYLLFNSIAIQFEKAINQNVKVDLSQSQFNALFIFAYNVGIGAFKKSTLLKRVNAGCNDDLIEGAFLMWKGKNNLLLSRRQKEIKMWRS